MQKIVMRSYVESGDLLYKLWTIVGKKLNIFWMIL
jgi:hypothetical protein